MTLGDEIGCGLQRLRRPRNRAYEEITYCPRIDLDNAGKTKCARFTSFPAKNFRQAGHSALLSLLLIAPASADMVLVMGQDGSLSSTNPQTSFARNYNDGIGAGSATDALHIFGEEDSDQAEAIEVAAVARSAPAPRADILAAINETGLRYASHRGLRAADVTVTDWLNLYRANIEVESAYNPRAVSSAGAIGLGQLMPDTARALGVDPHNWVQNLDGSARYLAMMMAEFGDVRLALAAYNAGPDAVRRYSGIPPYRETQNHVQRVLAVFNRLEGASQ